jgi:hypothetical protein
LLRSSRRWVARYRALPRFRASRALFNDTIAELQLEQSSHGTRQSNSSSRHAGMAGNRGINQLDPCSPTPSCLGFPITNPSWITTWDGPVDGPRDEVTPRRDGLGGYFELLKLVLMSLVVFVCCLLVVARHSSHAMGPKSEPKMANSLFGRILLSEKILVRKLRSSTYSDETNLLTKTLGLGCGIPCRQSRSQLLPTSFASCCDPFDSSRIFESQLMRPC